jgi:hypothetical protein
LLPLLLLLSLLVHVLPLYLLLLLQPAARNGHY